MSQNVRNLILALFLLGKNPELLLLLYQGKIAIDSPLQELLLMIANLCDIQYAY